jgi:hypothetical protein
VTLDTTTGELVPAIAHASITEARLTPAEAGEQAHWVREMLRSVLVEGTDYGTFPGVKRPTLFKAGAEMLLLAMGLGFTQERLDDDDLASRHGVTYRCTVRRGDMVRATCDGYAGYDERNYTVGKTPWNTIVKMAQKRALVGAALNAVAGSGLFSNEVEDDYDPAGTGTSAPQRRSSPTQTPGNPGTPSRDEAAHPAAAQLSERLNALSPVVRAAFRQWCTAKDYRFPPTSDELWSAMVAEVDRLETELDIDQDTYGS